MLSWEKEERIEYVEDALDVEPLLKWDKQNHIDMYYMQLKKKKKGLIKIIYIYKRINQNYIYTYIYIGEEALTLIKNY